MTHYFVTTPEMTDYYQDEPPETWRDYISVEAENKWKARLKAVELWRERDAPWIKYQREDNASPFTGLMVDDAVCDHGVCLCDNCYDLPDYKECRECFKEFYPDEEGTV